MLMTTFLPTDWLHTLFVDHSSLELQTVALAYSIVCSILSVAAGFANWGQEPAEPVGSGDKY